MRLLYAGTQIGHSFATRIEPSRSLLRDKADRGYGFRWTMKADGYLKLTDNQADTNAQMTALEAILEVSVGDLKFQFDDNTDTINSWATAHTFTGIRCVDFTWTGEPGAQFRTFRSFSATWQWEEMFSLTSQWLLDFTERVRIEGGVPAFVTHEAVNGVAPQSFGTVALTKWTASQVGRAVGLSQYPLPAVYPPIFGTTSPPLKYKSVDRTTPERKGEVPNHRAYQVDWEYRFESATELIGTPNVWS